MITQRTIDVLTVAYVAGVLVLAGVSLLMGAETRSVLPGGALDEGPAKALEITLDLTKQVIGLATVLIGACLWLLTRPLRGSHELVERLILTLAALLALAASLYFGFLVFDGSQTFAAWGVFDPLADMIWLPQTLQYYCFVGGGLLLGLACLRSINAIVERNE